MGEEFKWFNRPIEGKNAIDKDDDIQTVPELLVKPSKSSESTDSKGNKRN